jgi:hypothetical protein
VSGQFSYVDQNSTSNNTQKKNKKNNIPPLKTESWSSVNQSDSNEVVALGFGRFQLAGHPTVWADKGERVYSLQGFCEGKIGGFDFIRCRNYDLKIEGTPIEHLGDYGATGTQTLDQLFNGFSGYNSKLAYLEIETSGSKNDSVDNAPLITAVIRGLQIPVPDVNGYYFLFESSDNPVYILRYIFTDEKLGRVPTYRIADQKNEETAAICRELIEDRTNYEALVLPENEASGYGSGYRRYRSMSVRTAYQDMWENGEITGPHPDFEEPYINWYQPFSPPPLLPAKSVIRRRFSCNGALQEKTSILDFITQRILPTFRGWVNYNSEGQIEFRTREKADNTYLRVNIPAQADFVSVNNISAWRDNLSGYLLIGVAQDNAEIRKVTGIKFSTACNNLSIVGETTGGLTTTVRSI